MFRKPTIVAVLLAGLLLALPASSPARGGDDGDGGGDEVRTSGSCGGGASSELRIRAKDGTIELRFEVRGARRGSWRVVVVQERRIAWRGAVGAGGGFRGLPAGGAAVGPSAGSASSTTSPARTRSWSAPPGRAA